MVFRQSLLGFAGAACAAWLAASSPASASDLAYAPPVSSGWQFSFTPYAWAINVNGNVTARGHTVDINEDFFQIVDKSDSILAWMSYFEARKGRFSVPFFWRRALTQRPDEMIHFCGNLCGIIHGVRDLLLDQLPESLP